MASQGDAQMPAMDTPEESEAKRRQRVRVRVQTQGQGKGAAPQTQPAPAQAQLATEALLEQVRQLMAHNDQRTSSIEERLMVGDIGFQDHEVQRWCQRAVRLPD